MEREREITCPSGLKGTIRSIKVKDEQLYTDAKLIKSGGLPQALLCRCWLRVTDLGPYAAVSNGEFSWAKALQGDAFYATLQLRMLSYGADYEFSFGCDSCRRSIDTTFDLNELRVQALPPDSIAKMQSGEPFEANVGGRTVKFKLLYVDDEKATRMMRENRGLTGRQAALVQRIVELEGTKNLRPEIIRIVEDLDAAEFAEFEAHAESVDCGVDTEISVDCTICFYPTRLTLPFDTFYSSRKRSSTTSRTSTGPSE